MLIRKFKNEKKKLFKSENILKKILNMLDKILVKKVREIYYDKKSNKTIYGTTTSKERERISRGRN